MNKQVYKEIIAKTKNVRSLCYRLRPYLAELVTRGIIPERISKHRVLDSLLWYSEGQNK